MMDKTAWKILHALQENARIKFAELGKRVNLTAPAVAERIRKMEESGLIRGYQTQLNLAKLGVPMLVFIQISCSLDQSNQFMQLAPTFKEIIECYNVTGSYSYIIKAAVSSTDHLDELLVRFARFGHTTTQVVLSQPITQRIIDESFIE